MKQKMSDFDAVQIAEGCVDADYDRQVEAWQHLVDSGLVWKLQGAFGREAEALIDAGVIHA